MLFFPDWFPPSVCRVEIDSCFESLPMVFFFIYGSWLCWKVFTFQCGWQTLSGSRMVGLEGGVAHQNTCVSEGLISISNITRRKSRISIFILSLGHLAHYYISLQEYAWFDKSPCEIITNASTKGRTKWGEGHSGYIHYQVSLLYCCFSFNFN